MPKPTLVVQFQVKPQRMAEFLAIIRPHAAGTLADEPGCERFDVLTAADGSPTVILVEVYTNQAAYDLHRASDRLQRTRAAYQDMIEGRTLTLCDF
jgi:(4S)-4-hydroxy-5-phosphonooxypentane-2,3-dione isomerase